ALADDVPALAAHGDREEVRDRAEVEVADIVLPRAPVPGGRTVEVQGDDRLLVRANVGVLAAEAGREEEEPAALVDARRRPHAATAPGRPVEAAPGPAREEARGQPELRLGVVAVEPPDVVARERLARRPGLQVEVPHEVSVARVDGVEPALSVPLVHVHAEEDLAVRDDGGGLDLVALAREAAEPGRARAPRPRAEPPHLAAARRVDGVDVLARGDEDALLAVDRAHVGGGDVWVRGPGLVDQRGAPE